MIIWFPARHVCVAAVCQTPSHSSPSADGGSAHHDSSAVKLGSHNVCVYDGTTRMRRYGHVCILLDRTLTRSRPRYACTKLAARARTTFSQPADWTIERDALDPGPETYPMVDPALAPVPESVGRRTHVHVVGTRRCVGLVRAPHGQRAMPGCESSLCCVVRTSNLAQGLTV